MRIIKEDATEQWLPCQSHHYLKADTIEITDAEWQTIYLTYEHSYFKGTFPQYIRALISLTGEGK